MMIKIASAVLLSCVGLVACAKRNHVLQRRRPTCAWKHSQHRDQFRDRRKQWARAEQQGQRLLEPASLRPADP